MIHRLLRSYKGGYYRLCNHRSHRLRLSCYRPFWYDGQCGHHNIDCFPRCPLDDLPGRKARQ